MIAFRPFEMRVPAQVPSMPEVRNAFAGWLGQFAAGDDVENLLVVMSELVTNAVRETHEGTIGVHACVDGDAVMIDVTNAAPPRRPMSPVLPDNLSRGGRGLYIVDSLTDWMEVNSRPGFTQVRCRRRLTSDVAAP